MNRTVLALAALLGAALPSAALAQTVVVLPQVTGDAQLSDDVRAEAVSAVRAALVAEGLEVPSVEIPDELRSCGDGSCVAQLLEAVEVGEDVVRDERALMGH